jgi:hypothetical protein
MRIPWALIAVAKHRLAQFLALGAIIFAVTPRPDGEREIALTRAYLGRLERAESAKKGHASPAEVDERAIEDELLYREGLRIGFDKNDGVVKQRLIQKALFFAEELKGAADMPSDEELRRFYLLTRPTWKKPARHHLRQIFMKDESPLVALKKSLEDGTETEARALRLGASSPIPPELTLGEDELARTLGADFVAALASSQNARWIGPIRSAYGWHLVERLEDAPADVALFEEVKDRVREVYMTKRREDAVSAFLADAFHRYRVTIDGERVLAIAPQHRLAFRVEESGED